MRILLADDDTKIHVIVRMWLEKKGHCVDNEQLENHFASPKVHIHNKPFSPAALTELIETLSEKNQQDPQMAGVSSSGNAT